MSSLDRAANLTLAREQIIVARQLVAATERLLQNAELALSAAATRGDVYGDAIADIREAQRNHEQALAELRKTEAAILEFMNDRSEP